jgi:hypothetical protein
MSTLTLNLVRCSECKTLTFAAMQLQLRLLSAAGYSDHPSVDKDVELVASLAADAAVKLVQHQFECSQAGYGSPS